MMPLIWVLMAFPCASAPSPALAAPLRKPNVILISLDTLRSDRLSCYGYEAIKTSAVDSLASEGILFENAYAHATYTLPSHVTLFTSLYPLTHQVTNDSVSIVPSKLPLSMVELFKKNGYRTAAFTAGGFIHSVYGYAKGFDRYDEVYKPGEPFPIGEIKQWLEEGARELSSADRPVFVFLHTYEINQAIGNMIRKNRGKNCASDERLAENMSMEYDAGITRTDRSLGDLIQTLKDFGLYETSIILLFSDHGESFCAQHGNNSAPFSSHANTPYEEQIRVPMIFKLPTSPALNLVPTGSRVPDAAGLIDVAPTLLDLCGIAIPRQFQGRSLTPLLRGEALEDRPIFASRANYFPGPPTPVRGREVIAILRQKKKYIHHLHAPELDEFYDLLIDPLERTNLIESRKEEARDLFKELKRFAVRAGWYKARYKRKDKRPIESDLIRSLRTLGYLN